MLLTQNKKNLFLLGQLLLCGLLVSSPSRAQDEQSSGYQYLNVLRVRADMIPFSTNLALQTAAENHSNYLIINSSANLRVGGHFENPGDPGFTGNQAGDRAELAGYLPLSVGENVSTGQNNVTESIDDLMSAIYHRFGFFSFSKDEIGLGISRNPDINYSAFTYNLGNSGLSTLCQGESFSGSGSFFSNICSQDLSFRISVTDKTAAEDNIIGQNPTIVNWPVQGCTSSNPFRLITS